MDASWFDYNWVWIGSCIGIVLACLLFFTSRLRSSLEIKRRDDLYWLGWACSLAYFVHNFEEYGFDVMGVRYGFPDTIERLSGMLGGSGDVPALFFTVVNVSLVWVAMPILAYAGKKRPLTSLVVASVLFINAITHTAPLIIGVGYTSGAASAIVIFYPLSIWMFAKFVGRARGKLSAKALFVALGVGLLAHVVLMGSVMLFLVVHAIGGTALVAIQVVNAVLYAGLGLIAGKSKIGIRNP